MVTLHEDSTAPIFGAASFSVPSAPTHARTEPTLNPSGQSAVGADDFRALTRSIKRGDADAFARFYDLYSFRLYRFLLVLAHGDEHAAREIGQAVMTKLARRFKVFDDERQLWSWLCALAKNAFIDYYRAQRRRDRFVSLEEATASIAQPEKSGNQLAEMLGESLAALSPDERELLQAAYSDQLPFQELADARGLTYKAVESRLARLRLKLKGQLLKNLRHENES